MKTTYKIRPKYGLNKTDSRIINERLLQLRSHLEQSANRVLAENNLIPNRTLYLAIARKFRIQLTAINILITHLNHEKNEKNITSFRQSASNANGLISKITDRKVFNSSNGIAPRRKRNGGVSNGKQSSELRYNNVGFKYSSTCSASFSL